MKLEYEAYPYIVNQGWGVYNPHYEIYGFSLHNGIDIRLGNDRTVYAPIKCEVINVFSQAGGGNVVSVLTDYFDFEKWIETVKIKDEVKYIVFNKGKARVLLDYLHLESSLVKVGDVLNVGDKIAIADNTGDSTGPHTHCQARRVLGEKDNLSDFDLNEAHNSFNQSKFYNGHYAGLTGISRTLTYISNLLISLLKKLQNKG